MACLLALIGLAAAAAPAGAQSGLYEPFPSGHPTKQAKRYLNRLGQGGKRAAESLTSEQIAAGTFLGGARATRGRAASLRAGEASYESPAWPLQLLLLLVPFGAVVAATRA